MSAHKKLLIVLFISISSIAVCAYSLYKLIIYPQYENQIFNKSALEVQQLKTGITHQLHALANHAQQLSQSPELKEIIEDNTNTHSTATLFNFEYFQAQHINLMMILSADSNIIEQYIYDLSTSERIRLPELQSFVWSIDPTLRTQEQSIHTVTGMSTPNSNPLLMASIPVYDTHNANHHLGTIILGRFLSEDLLSSLLPSSSHSVELWPENKLDTLSLTTHIINHLEQTQEDIYKNVNNEYTGIFTQLSTLKGQPNLLLYMPVDMSWLFEMTTYFYAAFSIFLLFLIFIAWRLYISINQMFLQPLSYIQKTISLSPTQLGKPLMTSDINLSKEFNGLVSAFDTLNDELEQTKASFIEQSYYVCIAELNEKIQSQLRDIFKPLITTTNSIYNKLSLIPLDDIKKAQQEMMHCPVQSERYKALNHYLQQSYATLVTLPENLKYNLEELRSISDYILQLLQEQDKMDTQMHPVEDVALNQLLNEALQLIPDTQDSTFTLVIDPVTERVKTLRHHHTALRQVIFHIISNAVSAMQTLPQKSLRIKVDTEDVESLEPKLHIRFIDNGLGITHGKLKCIFNRNTTSKFGLHWCKQVVHAMNGRLYATSAGPNKGTTFHLIIPYYHHHRLQSSA